MHPQALSYTVRDFTLCEVPLARAPVPERVHKGQQLVEALIRLRGERHVVHVQRLERYTSVLTVECERPDRRGRSGPDSCLEILRRFSGGAAAVRE